MPAKNQRHPLWKRDLARLNAAEQRRSGPIGASSCPSRPASSPLLRRPPAGGKWLCERLAARQRAHRERLWRLRPPRPGSLRRFAGYRASWKPRSPRSRRSCGILLWAGIPSSGRTSASTAAVWPSCPATGRTRRTTPWVISCGSAAACCARPGPWIRPRRASSASWPPCSKLWNIGATKIAAIGRSCRRFRPRASATVVAGLSAAAALAEKARRRPARRAAC